MKLKYYLFLFLILVLAIAIYFVVNNKKNNIFFNLQSVNSAVNNVNNSSSQQTVGSISEPLAEALTRVTKKPFGLKVSPQDSPVSSERFFGYHTGVDFETLPSEQDINVSIYAICEGSLLLKKWASGYGGVVVQACQINNEDVAVVYGHLRLNSISAKVDQVLKSGQQIGILGKGFSTETDGERKHLHLGIHKGKAINLLGYVQTLGELDNWIDVLILLK
jgi:murein DD-endopeptidase MepM/ murein hydrolase activator NlpD